MLKEVGAYTGWNGAVLPAEYNEVSENLESVKERFLELEAKSDKDKEQWLAAWPFKDNVHRQTPLNMELS